jgi:hypothetical protein
MSCTILAKTEYSDKLSHICVITHHKDMGKWLKQNGNIRLIYEIHKENLSRASIHSRWIWKEKTERWGRTATPSTKKTTEENNSLKINLDRKTKKEMRKNKQKYSNNEHRRS